MVMNDTDNNSIVESLIRSQQRIQWNRNERKKEDDEEMAAVVFLVVVSSSSSAPQSKNNNEMERNKKTIGNKEYDGSSCNNEKGSRATLKYNS